MASLRDIRRRIRSVKNVAQITKAMETVAASRLRRAQERVLASRPFVTKLEEVLSNLADVTLDETPPLLAKRPVTNGALLLVTPNRGLAGSLIGNLNRHAARFLLDQHDVSTEIIAVGRKGRDFMARNLQRLAAEFLAVPDRPSLDDVVPIARVIIDGYVNGQFDRVSLVYSQFVSTLVQRPATKQLLPIEPPDSDERRGLRDFIYEPNAAEVLNQLLPRYVETIVYQAVLENMASFYAAQMVAMRNATDNANEVVGDLTLTYNKVRQATITREITEISAGAEALANA
ncbi:MAG: ATP synthase F1 subunit gamma [Chloroflexota bacterium]|nr:ATP synthase F1 subunit gamma [Chloroflexota bacterium]